jgi:hypothetical protein
MFAASKISLAVADKLVGRMAYQSLPQRSGRNDSILRSRDQLPRGWVSFSVRLIVSADLRLHLHGCIGHAEYMA